MTPPLTLVLGLGCDRGTPASTLARAVDAALAALPVAVGGTPARVVRAASIDLKADEIGLRELAAARGWPLHFYTAEELAPVPIPNPSETVRRHTGTASVSEAAALLAAGPGDGAPAPPATLLVEKYRLRGPDGRHATVSIARIAP